MFKLECFSRLNCEKGFQHYNRTLFRQPKRHTEGPIWSKIKFNLKIILLIELRDCCRLTALKERSLTFAATSKISATWKAP